MNIYQGDGKAPCMNPHSQQPQLWVNTNKSTMIVLSRLCIIYRMNNGNSQSRQCISHFFRKCRHTFQAIQAWFSSPLYVDNKKAGKRALPDAFWKICRKLKKKIGEPRASLPLQFKSCLKSSHQDAKAVSTSIPETYAISSTTTDVIHTAQTAVHKHQATRRWGPAFISRCCDPQDCTQMFWPRAASDAMTHRCQGGFIFYLFIILIFFLGIQLVAHEFKSKTNGTGSLW